MLTISKFQVSNPKLQVIFKLQFSSDVNEFFGEAWIFGHWKLFGIWHLVLGACLGEG